MRSFWEPVYDERDLLQWRRIAKAWRLRLSGQSYKDISRELGIDQRKCCALVSGRNLRPYLASMYLNAKMLAKPRKGWKWILQCTPKPTRPYPKAVTVPEKIQSFKDIVDFLAQFPPLPADNTSLRFFDLSTEWFESNRTSLFGFLLGFLVGDAGKYYNDYAKGRHNTKASLQTNMSNNDSNDRIRRFVEIPLNLLRLHTRRIRSPKDILRWTTEQSDIITWALKTCIGLKQGWRTSKNPLEMDWLFKCPREFIVSFIQGLAESDGSVDKHGYYVVLGSKPNSIFYFKLLKSKRIKSRVHPKHHPTQVRMTLTEATEISYFSPIIKSYRYQHMIAHAVNRRILPPFPSFSLVLLLVRDPSNDLVIAMLSLALPAFLRWLGSHLVEDSGTCDGSLHGEPTRFLQESKCLLSARKRPDLQSNTLA